MAPIAGSVASVLPVDADIGGGTDVIKTSWHNRFPAKLGRIPLCLLSYAFYLGSNTVLLGVARDWREFSEGAFGRDG